MQKSIEQFERLLGIMDRLRAECPWDKKQTMESLRHLTIEEVYELSDAILSHNNDEVKKELGDLILHIVFYAKIGSESGEFNIATVIEGICEKLIHRHPHIYGDVEVADEEAVKANWEKLKLKEGKKSVLEGVPASLPALVKSIRIQDKARGIGFDWENRDQVWEKVEEELNEFKDEVEKGGEIEEEFGDLMFSLVNYARFIGINPEDALEKCNRKFIKRFNHIEEMSKRVKKPLSEMSLTEMEKYWQEAKLK